MIQRLIVPLALIALAGCSEKVETASASDCAPADRRAQAWARSEVFAAERELQSALVGGSRFAAAKVPVAANPADVATAKSRLIAAQADLAAAGAVCGIAA